MTDEETTRAQAQHLRLLAELGGSATFAEMQEHSDFTSPSHFTKLRKQGFVALNKKTTEPARKVWEITDSGREVVCDRAEEWASACENIGADIGGLEA